MKTKKMESGNALNGGFLLVDVAIALGVAHARALFELENLFDVCPVLSNEVVPVMEHPTQGGHWQDTYMMSATAVFAFLGFIGIRDRTKLVRNVFSHPKRSIEEIRAARKAAQEKGKKETK